MNISFKNFDAVNCTKELPIEANCTRELLIDANCKGLSIEANNFLNAERQDRQEPARALE